VAQINIKINAREAFKEFLKSEKRYSCLVVHRRAGKTFACIQKIGIAALTHKRRNMDVAPLRYAFIAPTRDQAEDVTWLYMENFFGEIPGAKLNKSKLSVTLPNGAYIRLYSGENYERMRGTYFDGVVMDEYADLPPEAWSLVVRPCLSDYGGWAVFIGTPKGKNAFYHAYTKAVENPDWFDMKLKASESGIIPPEELEEIKNDENITADQFEQEYECNFDISPEGAIYLKDVIKAYAEGRISEDVGLHHEGLPVYTAGDIGKDINTKFWYFQVVGDKINILMAVSGGPELNTPSKWAALHTRMANERGYSYGMHFLPHDGETVWLPAFKEAGLDNVEVLKRPQNTWDDINESLRMFGRVYINEPECSSGIRALEAWETKEIKKKSYWTNEPEHNWASHWGKGFAQVFWAIACGRTVNKAGKSLKAGRGRKINVELAGSGDVRKRSRINVIM